MTIDLNSGDLNSGDLNTDSLNTDSLNIANLPPNIDQFGLKITVENKQNTLLQAFNLFLALLLTTQSNGDESPVIDDFMLTVLIADIDKKIKLQIDEILHHPHFQSLESSWRGLDLLVKQTKFKENIKIELLNLSQDDLLDDLEDASEVVKTGLYKLVYSQEYGQFGGEPYGVMIANYHLTPKSPDIRLMQKMASIGAMAHTPFIAAAHNEFFDIDSMQDLASIVDLNDVYESPKFSKWKRFRTAEDARYIGLVLPRFLLRRPYHSDTEKLMSLGIDYSENVSNNHEHSLWGNPVFLFVIRLAESFAKYRWCPHIIGPASGGLVEELTHDFYDAMGQIETKLATEVMVTDRREYELTEEGFIALTLRRGKENASFYSANSVQSSQYFGNNREDKEAYTNFKLGIQLPYLFIINRIAHYLKVIQRENIGSWKEQADVERGLNQWIKQYVSDQENPSIEIRSRRPLRKAKIEVRPVEGEPGWYRASVLVRPHFKYMGADFTLSLVGKLEVSKDAQQHRQQV
ncbi:type VI secretion system contractile sheath large subunit [sulfur-oxidizing endosymbiont of Gigantopelta aegis]|uniref:type VI secretion system contractile sheath large subunit n=1 Tax=sulfur-oxidizing endosymbiont of Gigantopelta aegis TaxID=2794934 RepID=UPI0018DDBEF3